jgi:hypothetical protein
MDFHEIWYLSIIWKAVDKIEVSLKLDKNNGYFTWRSVYIFIISCSFLLRMRNMIWCMIYLLTAIGLSPGGSTHLHTNNTENNTNNNRTTQITNNVEECGLCPVFASFTLAFSLQLRKKHGKTSVRVRKISVRLIKTSVRVQKCFRQICRGNQNTYFVFSTFFPKIGRFIG